MAINLPPDLEQSVRRHISSGQFHSAEDVLRAALHQFDEMVLAGLKQSAADEDRGRIVPLQTAAASIRRKHNFSDSQ
jgi:Arc/MetJ-type ribon-helix-helix transcriptional regulator